MPDTNTPHPHFRGRRFGAHALTTFCLTLGLACGPGASPGPGTQSEGHRDLSRLLVLSTTDFATGSIGSLNLDTLHFAEHTSSSSDARVFAIDDRVYALHRFGFDYLEVLEPAADWTRVAQIPLDRPGALSTNAQSLTRGADGLLYICSYGTPELLVVDPDASPAEAIVDAVDLSDFADADGLAEASLVFDHADGLGVVIQRLDQHDTYARVGPDVLVFVDELARTVVDVDPSTPALDALELPGERTRQHRPDPRDAEAAYLLANGLMRVDLAEREVHWVSSPERFAEVGLLDPLQPQAFDLDASGARAFVAAYDAGWERVDVYRLELESEGSESTPVRIISGLDSVDRSLEIVDDQIWFADTRFGGEGLRAFDLQGNLVEGPIFTGLPPYSLGARP